MLELMPGQEIGGVERLGWTLLHFLWQGTLIALIAGCIALVLRHASSQSRYTLWLMAMLALGVAPVATFCAVTAPSASWGLSKNSSPDLPEIVTSTSLEVPDKPFPVIVETAPVLSESTAAISTFLSEMPAHSEATSRRTWQEFLHATIPWFVGTWFAGVFLLSVRLGIAWLQLRKLLKHHVSPFEQSWKEMAARLQSVLRVQRTVLFLESGLARVPMVIGWLKPVVLVPTAILSNLTPREVEALLAHELAHLRRWDDVINLLQTLIETLLFYHPAIWWVSSRLRTERENCCDDLAVNVVGDCVLYSRALVSAAELALSSKSPPLALAANDGQITARVRRLLRMNTFGQPRSAWPIVMLVVLLTLGAVGLVASAQIDSKENPAEDISPERKNTISSKELSSSRGSTDAKSFSFGGKVEVIAIGTYREKPQLLWNANGAPLSSVPFTWNETGDITAREKVMRLIVIKADSLPNDSHVEWDTVGNGSWMSKEVFVDGKVAPEYFSRIYLVPKGKPTISLRVGVATGPWKTLTSADGSTAIGLEDKQGVIFSTPSQADNSVSVTASHNFFDKDIRVVAIDRQSILHLPEKTQSRKAGAIGQIEVTFSNLRPKEIFSFQFQVRDYEWIEFDNVPLEPLKQVSVDQSLISPPVPRSQTMKEASSGKNSDPQATEIALRAHALASAIDRLARFSIRAHTKTFSNVKWKSMSTDILERYMSVFGDLPNSASPYSYEPVFAWDQQHFLIGQSSPRAFSENQSESKSPGGNPSASFFQWGRRDLAGETSQFGNQPAQVVLRPDAQSMWSDLTLTNPNYLLITRHKFWWGDNGGENQFLYGSGLPPHLADYRSLGNEIFDGELCHVIESRGRMERLWISQNLGVIRGYAALGSNQSTDFYRSEKVREITGRSFDSERDFGKWYQEKHSLLPQEKQWALAKASTASLDPKQIDVSVLVRFRDFREIAPGVWWPFREDRVQGGKQEQGMFVEFIIDDIRTDFDLSETIASLQPKEGDKVNDQRFDVPVWYDFRADRTSEEILSLVAEEKKKLQEGQEILEKRKQPIQDLVGKPAPQLPENGWIGGERPDLKGKPYLIHFWATWCGPCKNDYPLLKILQENKTAIIGMHPAGTPSEEIRQAIKDSGLSYPTCLDSAQVSSGEFQSVNGFPVSMFPYSVLIDADGNIAAHGSLWDRDADVIGKYRELRDRQTKISTPDHSAHAPAGNAGEIPGSKAGLSEGAKAESQLPKPDGHVTTTVTVTNQAGIPVSGAILRITSAAVQGGGSVAVPGEAEKEYRTDRDGKAQLSYPYWNQLFAKPDGFWVDCQHPEFPRWNGRVSVRAETAIKFVDGLRLTLFPQDEEGNPLLETDLVQPSSPTGLDWRPEWKRTENGGWISPLLDPSQSAQVRVVLLKENGTRFSEAVDLRSAIAKGQREVPVILKPGFQLSGKITGIPLPLAKPGRILASVVSPGGGGWVETMDIPVDGHFEFQSLPCDAHVELIAICDGYVSHTPTPQELQQYSNQTGFPFPEQYQGPQAGSVAPQIVHLNQARITTQIPMVPTTACEVEVVDEKGNLLQDVNISFQPHKILSGGSSWLEFQGSTREQIFQDKSTSLYTKSLRATGKESLAKFAMLTDVSGKAVISNLPAEHPPSDNPFAWPGVLCAVTKEGYEVLSSEPTNLLLLTTMPAYLAKSMVYAPLKSGEVSRLKVTMRRIKSTKQKKSSQQATAQTPAVLLPSESD